MPIKTINLKHCYGENTNQRFEALKGIDIELTDHNFYAVIGKTGSGKTTLVQHFNALLKPSEGTVVVDDIEITSDNKVENIKDLRKKVGYVFQFPEYQLFEETVIKDVCFGPKNFGLSDQEAQKQAIASLKLVGIHESLYESNPFELSGGQKRRIAIAGVLASNPDVLILDEPTAGLDPQGAKDMMNLFQRINAEMGVTIIMITHDMNHVFEYCNQVIVMHEGNKVFQGTTKDLFKNNELLTSISSNIPHIVKLNQLLIKYGLISEEVFLENMDQAVKTIKEAING